jgi:hypothetical protein
VLDQEPKLRAVPSIIRPMIKEGIVMMVDAEVVPFV